MTNYIFTTNTRQDLLQESSRRMEYVEELEKGSEPKFKFENVTWMLLCTVHMMKPRSITFLWGNDHDLMPSSMVADGREENFYDLIYKNGLIWITGQLPKILLLVQAAERFFYYGGRS